MKIQHTTFSSRRRGPQAGARRVASAFTLIELMVVIVIIVIILAVAIPALGPMLSSSGQAQAVNTLNGLVATAQSAAEANGTPVAIRISQAYRLKSFKYNTQNYQGIRDISRTNDREEPLPYQEARLVKFTAQPAPLNAIAPGDEPPTPSFEDLPDTRVTPLPKTSWLAPIESIERDPANGTPIKDPASSQSVVAFDRDTSNA